MPGKKAAKKTTKKTAKKAKKKMGRPKKWFDPEQVFEFAKDGCRKNTIARYFKTSHVTLNKRLEDDPDFLSAYEKGRAEYEISLHQAQKSLAIDSKNPTMLIWLGKQDLEQRDQPKIEVTASEEFVRTIRLVDGRKQWLEQGDESTLPDDYLENTDDSTLASA